VRRRRAVVLFGHGRSQSQLLTDAMGVSKDSLRGQTTMITKTQPANLFFFFFEIVQRTSFIKAAEQFKYITKTRKWEA
jgi:hypothetical protein